MDAEDIKGYQSKKNRKEKNKAQDDTVINSVRIGSEHNVVRMILYVR